MGRRPREEIARMSEAANQSAAPNETTSDRAAAPLDMAAVMQMPEVQKAVADAAAKAAGDAVAAALANLPKAAAGEGGSSPDLEQLFSGMAHAIAEMSYQGNNARMKPVAPEVLAKREAATKKYLEVLAHAFAMRKRAIEAGDEERVRMWTPHYRVVSKCYLGDQFIEPYRRDPATKKAVPQDIYWVGPPSNSLEPLNQVALDIFIPYKESIGEVAPLEKFTFKDAQGNVHISKPDTRPFWMTPGGLVVQGDGPAKMLLPTAPITDKTGLKIDNNDPDAPFLQVLGTIAPPAQRNFAEKPQPVRSA